MKRTDAINTMNDMVDKMTVTHERQIESCNDFVLALQRLLDWARNEPLEWELE